MLNATSRLQLEAAEVRNNKPNWNSYLRLNIHRSCFIMGICRLMMFIFDVYLKEEKCRVEIFHTYAKKQKRTIWSWFLGILQRQDNFIVNQMSSVIAKLACFGKTLMEGADLSYYFSFLKEQLKASGNEYINTTARCLQMIRIVESSHDYMTSISILSALSGKTNFQLQYQLIFSLWSVTFNASIAEKIPTSGLIQVLGDILSESSKEKMIRIICATFRNLLEKIEDRELVREAALQMVQCKTLETLELMDAKKFDDVDLQEDIEFLCEKLHLSVQDPSSFDECVTELKSGRLQWSPVHKSEEFWRENAPRFNEKDFELVKFVLIVFYTLFFELNYLSCRISIGSEVQKYIRYAKTEQLQGKQAVMKLLAADDPNVRYH
uniref:ATPase V1 complex subunit H C-terminal domain-containing protein n=1 Tax=Parascaris equorum TaxID=6256 RepID=A0A914RHG2_PAREQ